MSDFAKDTNVPANDCISRQSAYATALAMYVRCDTGDIEDYRDLMCESILALPSAQQWIPCSERLPEEEKKTYWVCTDTEYQCECRWTNNRFGIGEGEWGWSIFDTPQYTKPIAWMPLPDPYKEEQ